MALRKSISLQNGLDAKNAYIKVEKVSIANKIHGVAEVSFSIEGNPSPFQHKTFCFESSINGKNAWEQTYEYLKTLPEFAGAVDC